MKKLFIMITLLSSFNLMAETSVKKLIDGTSAGCQSKEDLIKGQQDGGAYTVSIIKNKESEGQLHIDFKLTFLKCTEIKKGQFQFVKTSANDNSSYQVLGLGNQLENIKVNIANPKVRAISNDKIIALKELNNSNDQVSFSINKESIVDRELIIDLEVQKSLFTSNNVQIGTTEAVRYGAFIIRLN